MTTITYKYTGPAEALRPIAEQWRAEANLNSFGFGVDDEVFLSSLYRFANDTDSALFVLVVGPDIVGFIAGKLTESILDGKPVLCCNEQYWFVAEGHRGLEAVELKYALETWAKMQGAKHLLMTASHIGSAKHDSLCRLYERDMELFETTYIKVLC